MSRGKARCAGVLRPAKGAMTMVSRVSTNITKGIAPATRQSLLALIRGGCEMLRSTHPSLAGSVTVSRALDSNDGARFVERMAVRMAEEYNLDAAARTEGRTIVVRLSRQVSHLHRERGTGRKAFFRSDGA